MSKKIKNKAILIFQLLCGIVLIGVISDWFLNYSDETNHLISIVMFLLIGIAYLAFAWGVERKSLRAILLICGIFLIGRNFIDDSTLISGLTVLGVITPLLVLKLLPGEAEDHQDTLLDK
jgi:hypothetical protein